MLSDFILFRVCKPFCEKYLKLPEKIRLLGIARHTKLYSHAIHKKNKQGSLVFLPEIRQQGTLFFHMRFLKAY